MGADRFAGRLAGTVAGLETGEGEGGVGLVAVVSTSFGAGGAERAVALLLAASEGVWPRLPFARVQLLAQPHALHVAVAPGDEDEGRESQEQNEHVHLY